MSTPLPTAVALLVTLAATTAGLVAFIFGAPAAVGVYLLVFTALFALRVVGQLGVVAWRPEWLPPMHEWNFVPYRVLLTAQLAILALMVAILLGMATPGPDLARVLVPAALLYWAAMALRYARRMARRPDQRWFGGAIPIVYHCVLAAFLFVLGVAHAG